MIVINFLGILCAVYLFTTGAQPIQDIKRYFKVSNDSAYLNKYQYFLLTLLNCSLCFGFYVGLFYYQSILLAAIVSVSSELLTIFLNKQIKL